MGEALRLGDIGLYRKYVRLLLRKEQVTKDGLTYYLKYLKEFGEDLVSNLQIRNDCIRMKKKIAYVQAAIEERRHINIAEMEDYLDRQMVHHYRDLAEMAAESKQARKAKIRGKLIREHSDKIYRRISLLIHPDLNPMTWNDKELHELWGRVSEAYCDDDVVSLLDLESVIRKTVKARKIKTKRHAIKNLKGRITELEEEINDIVNSEPYTYRKYLSDSISELRKHDELFDQYDEYHRHYKELFDMLMDITDNPI